MVSKEEYFLHMGRNVGNIELYYPYTYKKTTITLQMSCQNLNISINHSETLHHLKVLTTINLIIVTNTKKIFCLINLNSKKRIYKSVYLGTLLVKLNDYLMNVMPLIPIINQLKLVIKSSLRF